MVLRDASASKKIVSFQLQMYKRTFQLKFVKINRSGVSEVVERKPFGSLAARVTLAPPKHAFATFLDAAVSPAPKLWDPTILPPPAFWEPLNFMVI